ncbi:biotin synthase BioB [Desulfonatronovibrio magnus]|uniref:biotin synthase BioB n=1 Tax=Desulfonatronovibrio magnus TaxID=698827 RepID=UPI0005EB68FF|nr:biotin synthase BioB [Desulfonatronovibrio magnus]
MNYFYELAVKSESGQRLTEKEIKNLLELPYRDTFQLFPGATLLREKYHGAKIGVCSITNAKSGSCSEDCSFCAQSAHYKQRIHNYPLKSHHELVDIGMVAAGTGCGRFSIVTSGKGLSRNEVEEVCKAVVELKARNVSVCASLGILTEMDFKLLKEAGLTRYHHNLETAPDFFAKICTTHDFSHRVQTINAAVKAGLDVCSGAVFGLGETDAHVIQLAMVLKELDVVSVPVNFLVPIPGTPLENSPRITPLRCLKIICMLRYILPEKDIIVCGGRVENLGELHPFIYPAGASSVMTGNYLTRQGRNSGEDMRLIREMGLEVL